MIFKPEAVPQELIPIASIILVAGKPSTVIALEKLLQKLVITVIGSVMSSIPIIVSIP